MIKTLNNTIKQDRTAYKIPRSVQDIIPIQRIFADGIFQFGTKYSRTLRFSDINYAIASKEDKTAMFLGYSELLNALDSGSTTKLTICNKQVNRQAFEDTVLLPQRGDSLDGFVDEFNGMLEGKISGSSASVEQERFITVSVHKKNVDEARTFFSRVTGEVSSKLSRLNSSSNELDAAERLDVLRGYPKPAGILQAVRTLSPQVVIWDELGTLAETEQLLQAVNCGVRFVASIHSGSLEELFLRPQFQLLQKEKAFEKVLLLRGADLPGQAAGIFKIEDQERQVEG